MVEVLTAAQMKAVEDAAIQSGAVTGLELMERAGQGVVDAMEARWPGRTDPVAVLCGPGNNGGDGYVVARLLRGRGREVSVLALGTPEGLPPDARVMYDRWSAMGPVATFDEGALRAIRKAHQAQQCLVIVDALFGIGQRAPLDAVLEPVHRLVQETFDTGGGPAPMFVAVDVPTGYDCDTGTPLARYPMPVDLIVTFHRAKPCHDTPTLRDASLAVVDIGL